MNELALRIGDAEREQAAAELGEHYVAGRLSVDEHGDRLDQVWAARTRGDLLPMFADLPDPAGRSGPAGRGRPARVPTDASPEAGGRYWASGPRALRHGVPTPLLVVCAFAVAITVVTHLPFVLFGLLAWMFVRSRHRSAHRPLRRSGQWSVGGPPHPVAHRFDAHRR